MPIAIVEEVASQIIVTVDGAELLAGYKSDTLAARDDAVAAAATATNIAANLTRDIGIAVAADVTVAEGLRPAEIYQPFDAQITHGFAKVTGGTGTFDAALYVNDALVHGPFAVSTTPTVITGLTIDVAEGQWADIEILDLTGTVTAAVIRFEEVPV